MPSVKPPLTWISGSVVYAEDFSDAWAVFRVATDSYDTQPASKRLAVQADIERMLHELGRDGQLVSLAREWDAATYLRGRTRLSTPLPALRDQLVEDSADEIAVRQIVAQAPRVFLGVSLTAKERNRSRDMAQLGKLRRGLSGFGKVGRLLAEGMLPVQTREEDQREAQRILADLQRWPSLARTEPGTTADLQWWIRRAWSRGHAEPVVDELDEPQGVILERNGVAVVEPLELDLLRWTGGISAGPRRPDHILTTSDEDGSQAVQQTLYATRVHCTAPSTDASLALVLLGRMQLEWPVDFAITWEWVSNSASLKRISGTEKRVIADLEEEDASELGASDKAAAAPEVAGDLRARLDIGEEPTLHACITLTLAVPVRGNQVDPRAAVAEALMLLRARSGETRKALATYCDTRFHVPPAQQLDAFYQGLPGQRARLAGYKRVLLPDQVAAQGWTAAEHVGTDTGWLFAHTISHRPNPVFLDPREGSRTNRAPAILCAGNLGSGKTAATGGIMLGVVLDGGMVIDVDPKGDHRWFTMLPAHMVQLVRLNANDPEQHGLLDPWICAPPELRATVAMSFLLTLLSKATGEEGENRLAEAVGEVADRANAGERVTNTDVLEALEAMDDPHATEVARGLRARVKHGLARLGFADRHTQLDIGRRPVTVLVTKALPRPDRRRSREEFTHEERVGEQISTLISHLAYRIMDDYRAKVKAFNSDEGWRDLNTQSGRDLFDAMQRMGRSELVVPMIGTQNSTDIDVDNDTIGNMFGVRLLFRQVDEKQAAKALDLCGLDQDPRIIKRLTELDDGQALMCDHKRRTGWIHTHIPQLLADAVFTTPNTDVELAEDDVELLAGHHA